MVEEINARATTGNSANLTITKEYLVVKGKHFQVRNGYLNNSNQIQAILVKDVLSMEYLTMRSKRLFILFIVLMTLVVFGGVGIRKTFSVIRQVDREVQKIENSYNSVFDEDINISITDTVKGIFSEQGIKGIVMAYMLLIAGSVVCFALYWMKPIRVLYISTLGMIIAVERRYYDKAQLDSIVNAWQAQL